MPVRGLTLLNGELFVLLYGLPAGRVCVYDSVSYKQLTLIELPAEWYCSDLTSCAHNRCLYISRRRTLLSPGQVYRVEPRGRVTAEWNVDERVGGLSVTPDR